MSLIHKIRIYHASLGILAVLAFFTGDFGLVHDWIGYGVGLIIVFRLLWAVFNPRQLGLNRFYPDFDGLRFDNAFRHPAVSKALILGVVLTLMGATVTGLLLDGGKAIGLSGIVAVSPAFANGDDGAENGGLGHEVLEEVHEVFSNLMVLFVLVHAGYLLLFKRPLARFMLYRDRRVVRSKAK
jgi:cytochrome b